MIVDQRTWQIYCGVVESRSMTATAERFFLSQPSVSMLIRKLERHFESNLLYRGGRQVRPTEAGLAVYHYAKEMIKADQEVRASVSELNEGRGGQAAIGATHMVGSYYLPPALTEFARKRPDAQVSVEVVPKHHIWPSILSGDLDFAMTTREGMPPGLICREFHSERLVAVCGPRHPLTRLPRVARADLLAYELIALSRNTALNQTIEKRLRGPLDDQAPPHIAMYVSHAEAIKRVVECNLGFAVLFECAVKRELQLGQLRDVTPLDMDVSYQPFAIVYRARKQFSPLQQQLLECLLQTDTSAADAVPQRRRRGAVLNSVRPARHA
jgi:DNA-binding transcriptional LysR family regulator